MLTLLLLGLAQAVAQADDLPAAVSGAPSSISSPPCSVVNVQDPAAKGAELYLVCGLSALRLGNADQYSSSYNPSLDAIVVVRQDGGQTNVSVASGISSSRGLHLDDISGEVLRAATGRNSDRGGASVDLTSFATDGHIAASATATDAAIARGTARLDLGAELKPASATTPAQSTDPQQADALTAN